MTKILAIDSSHGTSVAAVDGEHVLAQSGDDDPRSHAEVIGELLDTVLQRAGWRPDDVDVVACGLGPGPFTGLRVGIAAGVTFGIAVGAQVSGVDSHAAIAATALAAGQRLPLQVVTDAKRKEWFVTDFDSTDAAGVPVPASPTRVVSRSEHLVGALADATGASEPAGAVGVALVAAARLKAGLDLAPVVPNYVRDPDISAAKPKQVLQ